MCYLFIALYLLIGYFTYISALGDDEYCIFDQLLIMIIHPLVWLQVISVVICAIYRSLKNKTDVNEEMEKIKKKIEERRKDRER